MFRREAGRLVAVLARLFGMHNLALAEDVVQDAFCRALETWKFHGVPDNPSAWLMTTAKRRALDVLRREGTARKFAPELQWMLESEWTLVPSVEEQFDGGAVHDAQLRMMFSCAHPDFPDETRVALVLNLTCGFSAEETAAAFLKQRAATQKRLSRAKQRLSESQPLFDMRDAAGVAERLPAVLRAVYLVFSEGYHASTADSAIRAGLCAEALHLAAILLQAPATATPATHALAALMHFDVARLPARLDANGDFVVLEHQDRSRWDEGHVAEGRRQLDLSARGEDLTAYHVQAAIAALHAEAATAAAIDWEAIVALYDTLLAIDPSPVVALNRAIAIARRDGPARGLEEIGRIDNRQRLDRYPFLHVALGEFELALRHALPARMHFEGALALARNPAERRFIQARIRSCDPQ